MINNPRVASFSSGSDYEKSITQALKNKIKLTNNVNIDTN